LEFENENRLEFKGDEENKGRSLLFVLDTLGFDEIRFLDPNFCGISLVSDSDSFGFSANCSKKVNEGKFEPPRSDRAVYSFRNYRSSKWEMDSLADASVSCSIVPIPIPVNSVSYLVYCCDNRRRCCYDLN